MSERLVARPRHAESSGEWAEFRRSDPSLHAAYVRLADAPWSGGSLKPVVRALLLVAAAGTVSGIDQVLLRGRIQGALDLGASAEEIREVLAVTSVLGIHSCVVCTQVLTEEMRAADIELPDPERPEVALIRAEFIERRGYWSPLWDAIARFDPLFLKAYLDYSSIPGEREVLDARTRELILVVLSSVTTHLFPDGLRVHVKGALALGVPPTQIVETFELLATHGVASILAGYAATARL